jgi:hypothetical protein
MELGLPKKVDMAIANREGKPIWQEVIAAGDRLIVYEPFAWWFTLDRRSNNAEAPGGWFAIDPASGVFEHLSPSIDFAQLVASGDGRNLIGFNAGAVDRSRQPSLLRLESKTGAVLKKRDLERDVWHISVARIPQGLIPHGEVVTVPCQNANELSKCSLPASDIACECPESIRETTLELIENLYQSPCFVCYARHPNLRRWAIHTIDASLELDPERLPASVRSLN